MRAGHVQDLNLRYLYEAAKLRRKGPDGDVYGLERDRTGRDGRVMKYDLHRRGRHAT